MKRALVLTMAGAVIAGLAAFPAVADGWVPTPATVIYDNNRGKQAFDLAVSSNGDAIAVWVETTAEGGTAVKASVRHAGTWSDPAVIESGAGSSVYPRAVIDQNGFATVVWSRWVTSPSTDKTISFATRPAEGDWSTAAKVVAEQSESLELAMTPDGSVSAAWQSPSGGAYVADKAAGGTTWTVTTLGGQGGPVLAAGADNRMAVAWNQGGNNEQLGVRVRSAETTWAQATTEAGSVADPGTEWLDIPAEPVIGFGADGALHVAYWEYEDPTAESLVERLRYSTRSAQGVWAYHPTPLSDTATIIQPLAVTGDSEGNVTLVWDAVIFSPFGERYWAATRVAGSWEAPYPLTGAEPASGLSTPELLLDDEGVFTVTWGQDFAAKSNRRTAAGDWLSQPQSIAPSPAMWVQSALEANGDAVATWNRTYYVGGTEFHSLVETRTYDTSAPPTDVTGPVTTMTQPVKAFYLDTYLPLAWTAVDAESAVASSRNRYRAAPWNGGYPTQYENLSTFGPGSSSLYLATPGKTFCFQAQSRDTLDNEGAWSGDLCTATPVDDRAAARKGRWAAVTGEQYYRGTALRSKDRGATLTLDGAQAKRIGLVVTKCKGCGKVSVRFAGQLLGTWSLNAKKTRNQVYLPVKLFGSVRTGRIVVKVVSPEGTRVIVDGVLVGRR